jgi:hypothetical protein
VTVYGAATVSSAPFLDQWQRPQVIAIQEEQVEGEKRHNRVGGTADH